MREWKRGEIQALGAVAKLMILGGGFVAMYELYLEFRLDEFTRKLPGSLISGPFPRVFLAVLVALAGCALALWLWRVGKRAGVSTRPFERE
jgi:hypothetical protein